jgi:lipopolysaccharide biosynthesis glycosyltransferase
MKGFQTTGAPLTTEMDMPHIVFVVDEAFAMLLAVALRSLGATGNGPMRVFIVDCGLEPATVQLLRQVAPTAEVLECLIALPNTTGAEQQHVSKTTWCKLWLHQVLPLNTRYVLLLDCDLLIRADVALLWQRAMSTISANAIAAVRDAGLPTGQPTLPNSSQLSDLRLSQDMKGC